MKILTALIVLQTLLLMTEARSVPQEKSKRVVCYYLASTLYPFDKIPLKNIDVSVCTHLIVDKSLIILYANEHYIFNKTGIDGRKKFLEDYHKLKEVNPDLKLIAQCIYWFLDDIYYLFGWNGSKNISHDAVTLVKEMGFDGLEVVVDITSAELMDKVTEVVCDMKTEFEKNGLIITTIISPDRNDQLNVTDGELNYSKLARCYDHMTLYNINQRDNFTYRFTSLAHTKVLVEKCIRMGIPPKKIMIPIPVLPTVFVLADPTENGLGAKAEWKKEELTLAKGTGHLGYFQNLMAEIKNSSFGWTVRRDEETKEPYAFDKEGVWAGYEDRISTAVKAKYVLERGLGGTSIMLINLEDGYDIAGEGTFPIARTAFNTFKEGLRNMDSYSTDTNID